MFCLAADEGLLPHPHVIVEPAPSGLVACALTSNLHRARDPGNVLLEPGGGDLPEQTVVVVSQSVSVAPRGTNRFARGITARRDPRGAGVPAVVSGALMHDDLGTTTGRPGRGPRQALLAEIRAGRVFQQKFLAC